MTDHDAPTQPLPDAAPPAGPPRPPLRRSGSDRVLLGVGGGLGRHLGIDPVLLRVAFVVLAFVGGLGIGLYALLAIAMRGEDGAPGRGGPLGAAVVAALVLVVGVIGLGWTGDGLFFFAPGVAFLALLAVVAVLLVRGLRGEDATLATVLLALALVLVSGGLAVAAAAGVAFGGGTTVAIVAVGIGVALLVAGLLGGARWLILPALAIAIPATVAQAADVDLRGPVGNREFAPTALAAVQPEHRLGVGRLRLDYRAVPFRGTTTVAIDAGMGRVEVLVPRGVCVTTRATLAAGDVDLFGRHSGGFDVTTREDRTARRGRPTLRLEATMRMGQLTVAHDPAQGYEPVDAGPVQPQRACRKP